MILEHYTAEPFVLEQRQYEQPSAVSCYDKPDGLWVSVRGEDDWPTWCRDAEFREDTLAHCARIEIDPAANVLLIGHPEMETFEQRFGAVAEYMRAIPVDRMRTAIDWRKVADAYDGIIIAPYAWQDRLTRPWYYGFDCASGCIWNTAIVRVVGEVKPTMLPTKSKQETIGNED